MYTKCAVSNSYCHCGYFTSEQVGIRCKVSVVIVSGEYACIIELENLGSVINSGCYIRDFFNIIYRRKVSADISKKLSYFVALNLSVIVLKSAFFQETVSNGVIDVHLVPLAVGLRNRFIIECFINSSGNGYAFGNCQCAGRVEGCCAVALHNTEFVRVFNTLCIPFACRHVAEHTLRIGLRSCKVC